MNSRGFTFIEMMIVMAIIGVMAGISFTYSNISKNPSFKAEQALIYDAFVQARSIANARRACVQVTVEALTIKTTVHDPKTGGLCTAPLGAETRSLPTLTLPANIHISKLSNGRSDVVFGISGGLNDESIVSFEVTDDKALPAGTVAYFRIYPAIGQVRLN